MARGSCLCGGVRFIAEHVTGPLELCHCGRCRKASGSAFLAAVGVRRDGFRFLQGQDLIATYEAPLIEGPPAYATAWCVRCGAPAPFVPAAGEWFEIPAGLFDDPLPIAADKHIFVEFTPGWDTSGEDLPRYDKIGIRSLRSRSKLERP